MNQMVFITSHPFRMRLVSRMNPCGQNPAIVNHVNVLVAAAHQEAVHQEGWIVEPLKVCEDVDTLWGEDNK